MLDSLPLPTSAHIHIIGINGAGMSASAHLLLDQGYVVSGCDREVSPASAPALTRRGVTVGLGHSVDHLVGVDALLRSSAVPSNSPEVQAAQLRGLPVLTRHDFWRAFSRQREVVAVSGTHGKTTISSLLAHIYRSVGKPHGELLGAPLGEEPAGRWGSGDLIVEADEYDRTFLALTPKLAVISNVDYDHVDIYADQAEYEAAFRTFAHSTLASGGAVIACGDDPGVGQVLKLGTYLSYGLNGSNDWQAINLQAGAEGMTFTLLKSGRVASEVKLPLQGEHNVLNALAALSTSTLRGIPLQEAIQALAGFPGVPRRMQWRGGVAGVLVYDDYAHHPTEVRAVLNALRGQYPEGRLIALFQPHTYTRWLAFEAEFHKALQLADVYQILPVYGAREAETHDGGQPALQHVTPQLQAGDVVVVLSAGDGPQLSAALLRALQQGDQQIP